MSPSWFSSNRLTPEPEGRSGVVRLDNRVGQHVRLGWARENKRNVFEAMENKVVIPDDYCMCAHQERIDQKPPKPSDPGWRQGHLVSVSASKPTVIVDHNGVVAAWVFPGFLSENSLEYANEFTTAHAKSEFPKANSGKCSIKGAKSNGKLRGGIDTYTTTHGIWGTATYCVAWHEQVHEHDKSFIPSKDLISARSVAQAVQRDLFVSSFQDIHWKINNLVSLVHPDLHSLLSSLKVALTDHPTCRKLLSTWGSIFPGHSLICNRTTGEHIDKSGVRRGFEVILANGEFSGGDIFLKDLNIRIPFLPGTLVMFDGTALRHRIEPWRGEQRFSHALFIHRSVLRELHIEDTLSNVSTEAIYARLRRAGPAKQLHNPRPVSPSTNQGMRRKKRIRSDPSNPLPRKRHQL